MERIKFNAGKVMGAVAILSMLPAGTAQSRADEGIGVWEAKLMYSPSASMLEAEDRGRVNIISGATEREVHGFMDAGFERIDHMMFVRTIKSAENGTPEIDPQSGEVVVEDDGCD